MANQTNWVQKNQAYDHILYLQRQTIWLPASTAGANGTYGKFYAKGNEIIYSAGAIITTLGAATSVYTQTTTYLPYGTGINTATTVLNTWTAAQISVPYSVVVRGTTTTTTTFSNNSFVNAAVNSTNGTDAHNNWSELASVGTFGGIACQNGDFYYMVGGTDTAAVVIPYSEIAYQPLSNIPS
jgi:hypothetical protein